MKKEIKAITGLTLLAVLLASCGTENKENETVQTTQEKQVETQTSAESPTESTEEMTPEEWNNNLLAGMQAAAEEEVNIFIDLTNQMIPQSKNKDINALATQIAVDMAKSDIMKSNIKYSAGLFESSSGYKFEIIVNNDSISLGKMLE
jgi:hypothetical protein